MGPTHTRHRGPGGMAALALLAAAACATGCGSRAILTVELGKPQSVTDIGAGQGVAVRDGRVYLYGDADTGIIREYVPTDDVPPRLEPTGRVIRLTRHGRDLVPHPTGLTFHHDYGAFLGNTVGGRGTIYHVDWRRMLEDGNLDRAVMNTIDDDLAINGTRPQFVAKNGRWYVATADYGDANNAVRLYDPNKLAAASRTSEPGVLTAQYPCGPWVQNLCWLKRSGRLVLVQNISEGRGWRLTFVNR